MTRRSPRLCLAIPCLTAALATSAAASPQDASAKLEVSAEPATVWVGQEFVVRTRIRVDTKFFATRAIQILRRKLDLPVQVDASWMRELDGARIATSPPPTRTADRTSIAAGGGLTFVARAPDGSYVLETRVRADRAGRLAFEAPTMRYAWTSRFETDFLGDPKPVDRKLATVQGNAIEVRVRALPTDDVPDTFTGAVGTFRLRASLGPRGATIPFALTLEGVGDFERLAAPKLGTFPGLHVQGMREQRTPTKLTIAAELVVTDETNAYVPSLEYSWFDPIASKYETRTTDVLLVHGSGPSAVTNDANTSKAPEARPTATTLDILDALDPITAGDESPRTPWGSLPWLILLALPWCIAAGCLTWTACPNATRART